MNKSVWIAAAVTLLFWSSAFAGIRAGILGGYSPGALVLLRFVVASSVFLLYALVKRVQPLQKKDLLRTIAMGLCGIFIYHTALTFGERVVPAGTASLLIAAAPVFTALISVIVEKQRLYWRGWFGIALGMGGAALVTLGAGHTDSFTGSALLILLSAVSTSVFFVFQKPLYKTYKAIDLTAYFTWFGTIPMLVFLPQLTHEVTHASLMATLSGIYIGIFPAAVAYVSWGYALSKARTHEVASLLYINPVLAVLVAWVWLDEKPQSIAIFGGIAAIIGVIIVNSRREKA